VWVGACTAAVEDTTAGKDDVVVDAVVSMARSSGAVREGDIVRLLGPVDYTRKAYGEQSANYRYDVSTAGAVVKNVIVNSELSTAASGFREHRQRVRFEFNGLCLTPERVKNRSGVFFEDNQFMVPVHHGAGAPEIRQMKD